MDLFYDVKVVLIWLHMCICTYIQMYRCNQIRTHYILYISLFQIYFIYFLYEIRNEASVESDRGKGFGDLRKMNKEFVKKINKDNRRKN